MVFSAEVRDGGDGLEDSIRRDLEAEFTELARMTRCPKHGVQHNVRVSTEAGSDEFSIEAACCEEYVDLVIEALS